MHNQAAEIRKAFDELGMESTPKAVIALLRTRGLNVSPQQVSNEKAKLIKRSSRELKDLPVSVLKKVKLLVDELGGTDRVRHALDELDALMGKSSP
jgi:hypothetical protein